MAHCNLMKWRSSILKDYKKRHFQSSLSFENQPTRNPLETNPTLSYATLFRPILREMLSNRFNCFAGIGNYSANDLLHTICVHPFTPSHVICASDELFAKFELGIKSYIAQFSAPDYLNCASSVVNTTNPFAFNDHQNTEFLSKWILVYQRSCAVVPIPLFNEMSSLGLLDPAHEIGMYGFMYTHYAMQLRAMQEHVIILKMITFCWIR